MRPHGTPSFRDRLAWVGFALAFASCAAPAPPARTTAPAAPGCAPIATVDDPRALALIASATQRVESFDVDKTEDRMDFDAFRRAADELVEAHRSGGLRRRAAAQRLRAAWMRLWVRLDEQADPIWSDWFDAIPMKAPSGADAEDPVKAGWWRMRQADPSLWSYRRNHWNGTVLNILLYSFDLSRVLWREAADRVAWSEFLRSRIRSPWLRATIEEWIRDHPAPVSPPP